MKDVMTVMVIGAVIMVTGELIGFYVSVGWGVGLLLGGFCVFVAPMVSLAVALNRLRRGRSAGRHKQ